MRACFQKVYGISEDTPYIYSLFFKKKIILKKCFISLNAKN